MGALAAINRVSGRAKTAVSAFVGLSALHLGSQLVEPDGLVAELTQPLLMPALGATLLTATDDRGRLVRWTLCALAASWLGDTIPRFLEGDPAFLSLIGCFLSAQLAYIAGFWPFRREALPVQRPLTALGYLAALVGMVAWCREGAGALLAPVIVYGLTLSAMAALSTGVSARAGIGGAIFLVSDSLIALHAFADIDLPYRSFWVMSTYLAAQSLIVRAVVERPRSETGTWG